MTLAGLARLNDRALAQGVFIRRAPGVNDLELTVALGRVFGTSPELLGPRSVDPERKLAVLRETNDVPSVFGALMALMATAVLAHVLVSALGQHRRDLALLRTLGFTRGQISRMVGWQASTYALITLVVSVPLGVVLGRAIWRSYAESIGVVPEAATPWGTLAAVTLAAFVIANMIAAYPARRATRAAPAAILRTE
jgi:ABC-type lipoprotein release transport system permease subunit